MMRENTVSTVLLCAMSALLPSVLAAQPAASGDEVYNNSYQFATGATVWIKNQWCTMNEGFYDWFPSWKRQRHRRMKMNGDKISNFCEEA
jgi:hypothetical protein